MTALNLGHPLLDLLDAEQRGWVERHGTARQVRKGGKIIRLGQNVTEVVFLLRGAARCFHRAPNGAEVMLRLLQAPAVFGEMEALAERSALEDAVALEPCEVLSIPVALYWRLTRANPDYAAAVIRSLSEQLCIGSINQYALAFSDVERRLASLLADYGDFTGEPTERGMRITYALSQERMAQDLGVSRVAVARALDTLKKEGHVLKEKARYLLPNIEALREHHSLQRGRLTRTRIRPVAPDPARSVSLRFPIPVVEAGQAPFYVALDQGHFKAAGLQVSLRLSSKTDLPAQVVSEGIDTFGVLGGPDAVLVARSRGLSLKLVAVLHRNANFPALLVPRASSIRRPEHLDGKRIGFFYGHISADILRAWLKGLRIKFREVDVGWDVSALTSGRVDAMWAYSVTDDVHVPDPGAPVRLLKPADYGFASHGYAVFTTDRIVAERPDVVRRFVQAMQAGARHALRKPDEAWESLRIRDPSLDPRVTRARLRNYLSKICDSSAEPPGYFDRVMISEVYERLASQGLLKRPFDVAEVMASQFLA